MRIIILGIISYRPCLLPSPLFRLLACHPVTLPPRSTTKSNGLVDDATHQSDLATFDETEGIPDGLGPLYNAQSCRECHQNPVSGSASQVN